jgi:predicted Zn-dependent protease
MEEQFNGLVKGIRLKGDEGYLASFSGEYSDFVRYNRAAVRQAGAVEQRYLTLELFAGRRHAATSMALTGQADDTDRLNAAVAGLRDVLADQPEDPLFLINTTPQSTRRVLPASLPSPAEVVDAVLRAGAGHDLVGFSASGPIHRGFASSFGQHNWDTVSAFNIDLSFYLQADKAVKMTYAGTAWDAAAFAAKTESAKARLKVLARPAKTVTPGGYRVYLEPAAMEEIMSMLGWGGFSMAEHRTATTPLIKMVEQGVTLSPMVTLRENTKDGLAPGFQSKGFVKPDTVTLIDKGVYKDCMTSPRSAVEFNAQQNGADENAEMPLSLDMRAGNLQDADVLKTIGTGIYVGNLWYLNYSDRNACRLTGMTRFATFWVENGEIVAPLNVMRFDDTVYRMLGDNLVALTAARDLRLSTSTYDARSTQSMHLPGAVIDDLRMTL